MEGLGRQVGREASPARPQEGGWGVGNWRNKEPLQNTEETPAWGVGTNRYMGTRHGLLQGEEHGDGSTRR